MKTKTLAAVAVGLLLGTIGTLLAQVSATQVGALVVNQYQARNRQTQVRVVPAQSGKSYFGFDNTSKHAATTYTAAQILTDAGITYSGGVITAANGGILSLGPLSNLSVPNKTDTLVGVSTNTVQHTQLPLSTAQLKAMSAAPIQVVAAPASGVTAIPLRAEFRIIRTATAFTGGGAVQVQYNNTAANGGVQALDSTLAATVVTGGAGTSTSTRNGAIISDVSTIEAVGIFITNGTANFGGGDTGSATLDLWYVLTGN